MSKNILSSLHQPVLSLLNKCREKTSAPNLSAAIWIDGEELFVSSGTTGSQSGPAVTADTCLATGTFNQTLIRAALLKHCLHNDIALDSPLKDFLPDLPTEHAEQISLQNLLSFSSGIQEDNLADLDVLMGYQWEDLVENLQTSPLLFTPGKFFNPIYTDTVILARILETLTGTSCFEAVTALLKHDLQPFADSENSAVHMQLHQFDLSIKSFRPAELPEWGEFWQPAVAGPALSLRQLLAIAALCSQAKSSDAQQHWRSLYSSDGVTIPEFISGIRSDLCPQASYSGFVGYGDNCFGPYLYSSPECFTLRIYPEHKTAVVISCNWDQPQIRNLVLQNIEKMLRLRQTPTIHTSIPLDFDADRLVGEYQGRRHASYNILRQDDTLVISAGPNPCLPLTYTDSSIKLKVESKRLIPQSGMTDSCISFFYDKELNIPYLMKGMSIYKKLE